MKSSRMRSQWYRLYVILVLLNISVIVGGVYVSRYIKKNYAQSVRDNQEWVDRLSSYADITQLASSVNAPGNDVFDTLQIDAESSRRDRARIEFDRAFAKARADLQSHVDPQAAEPLLASLDRAGDEMRRMVEESKQIFVHLRQGETREAAAFMASMDRQYALIAAEMTQLVKRVGVLQTQAFEEQVEALRRLEELELLIAALLVVIVTSSTFYGYKAVQRLYASEEELERYSARLAKAWDAANAANKAKSDFLAVLSHEIRTPLTTVLGSADLLAVADLPEKTRGHVHAIQASGRHLLSIVNDVLDFSRIEAVGVDLDHVDFSLKTLFDHVQWLMGPAAAERGIALEVTGDIRPDRVLRGDPTRLRQILLNLLSNALKFTAKGTISVSVAERGEGAGRVGLRVEVRDTGIGIPHDKQSSLFRPFSSATTETAKQFGGTGLGLAICRRLVEAMGGSIGVHSTPGQGSTFWFDVTLDLGDPDGVVEPVAFGPISCAKLRILIVEDAELNRHLLAEVLNRQGHEVTSAVNGEEALDLIRRHPVDVILMDVQMPTMDGMEATRRIRAMDPPVGSIPVVGLTANVIEEVRQQCLAAGMNRCLSKPFAWPELFVALTQVTAGSQAVETRAEEDAARVDVSLFDRFGVDFSANQAAQGLLPQVLEDAEQVCAQLQEPSLQQDEILHEAHKLKGTAGLFGLKHIRKAAAELHKAAKQNRNIEQSLRRLAAAVAATRDELKDVGLIGVSMDDQAQGVPPDSRGACLADHYQPHDGRDET